MTLSLAARRKRPPQVGTIGAPKESPNKGAARRYSNENWPPVPYLRRKNHRRRLAGGSRFGAW